MPSDWIRRTFEPFLTSEEASLRLFPVWLLLGPRQVGKSSLLARCAAENRQRITLDDLAVRAQATQDPVLFARNLRPPFLIDEIQYAPELLSPIKQLADAHNEPGLIWLTGSQNFEVMRGVRESLAGRVAILQLLGLSDEEKGNPARTPREYFDSIVETAFPKLRGVADCNARDLYLASYTATYLERDVRELLEIDRRREFEVFLRMCALRTGSVINYDELSQVSGVSSPTVKKWLSVLQDSFVIRLVPPYHSNRSKRLIKSPKLYFLDAGLAAFLAGWRDGEMLRLSPASGSLFETHVFSQLVAHYMHRGQTADVHFWRTRDGQEIDFLVEAAGKCWPIEVKVGTPSAKKLPVLERIAEHHWQPGRVVSLAADPNTLPLMIRPDWTWLHPYQLLPLS